MSYTLNLDADEILYSAAFAVEQTAYKLETSSGKIYNFGTKYDRKELIAKCGLEGKALNLDYKLKTYKVAIGPAGHAIQCMKHVLSKLNAIGNVRLFLTSTDQSNFRFEVAKTEGPNGKGYKAGRPPKPIYYQECRDWLLKRGAEEVFGYEADDALGIHQTEETVAVHIDKDINRIAGKHYNWKTKERYIVEQPGKLYLDDKRKLRGNGNAFFFAQMLSGDRVDNIPSLGRFGDVEIYTMLEHCKTEQDYYEVISTCFCNHYGIHYIEQLLEIADLLYIMDSTETKGSDYIRSFKYE